MNLNHAKAIISMNEIEFLEDLKWKINLRLNELRWAKAGGKGSAPEEFIPGTGITIIQKYPEDYKEFVRDILEHFKEYDKIYGTTFPKIKEAIEETLAGDR